MRYQIYEAKSVKYDAQQRMGVVATIPKALYLCGFSGFLFARSTRKVHDGYTNNFKQSPVNGLQLHPVL